MKRFAIAVAGIAALLAFGASGAAQASVAPRPDNVVGTLYDQVGNAGYYTQSFANTYNQVNGSFTLTYQGTEEYGGVGLQLCSATDGHAAQLGAEPTGTEGQWFIGYWRGYLDNENPTGDGDPCNGSPFLTGTGGAFVNLGTITLTAADPTATVQARIDQTARGIEFYASDSALVTYGPVFVPSFADPFTEAAAGISLNGTSLTPRGEPAVGVLERDRTEPEQRQPRFRVVERRAGGQLGDGQRFQRGPDPGRLADPGGGFPDLAPGPLRQGRVARRLLDLDRSRPVLVLDPRRERRGPVTDPGHAKRRRIPRHARYPAHRSGIALAPVMRALWQDAVSQPGCSHTITT